MGAIFLRKRCRNYPGGVVSETDIIYISEACIVGGDGARAKEPDFRSYPAAGLGGEGLAGGGEILTVCAELKSADSAGLNIDLKI